METTQYELKSTPGETIDIPVEYDERAQTLVGLTLQGVSNTAIRRAFPKHLLSPEGTEVYFKACNLAAAVELRENTDYFQDVVYLNDCLRSDSMRNPKFRKQGFVEIITDLIAKLERTHVTD